MTKKLPIIICLLLCVFAAETASAQGSIYLKGGISKASGLDFQNVNPSFGATISPEIGGGLSYEFDFGLRIGGNYEFTKLRREQRLSALEPTSPKINQPGATYVGGTAYRERWSQFNNADISFEYNFCNLMPAVKAVGVGLYLGTGVGVAITNGNTYTISMAHEELRTETSSADTWLMESWLSAENDIHEYKAIYVPVSFNAEYALSKMFAIGIRCEYKALFAKSVSLAPKGIFTAGAVIRMNLF